MTVTGPSDVTEPWRVRLFGTDGVRGVANRHLTAELVLELAVSAAHVLGDAGAFEDHRPVAVVGRDPRASGEFLEAAVIAGLASAGVDVLRAGIVPTPAVAYLTAQLRADVGVMLSASHNPMPDNGLKFFARGGHKLADELEDAIEARLLEDWERPTGSGVGRVRDLADATSQYVQHLVATLPNKLTGLTVVVDCAHGAAYEAAPEALRLAGATVSTVGCEPDGLNINDGCGSTHLEQLIAAVVERGADVGFARMRTHCRQCHVLDKPENVPPRHDVFEVQVMRDEGPGRLVAAVELVSPANKDRPSHREGPSLRGRHHASTRYPWGKDSRSHHWYRCSGRTFRQRPRCSTCHPGRTPEIVRWPGRRRGSWLRNWSSPASHRTRPVPRHWRRWDRCTF